MQKYSLSVTNNSNLFGNICVFQTLPDQPENMVSLAWFSEPAHPGTTVEFDWSIIYNFVWSRQGDGSLYSIRYYCRKRGY